MEHHGKGGHSRSRVEISVIAQQRGKRSHSGASLKKVVIAQQREKVYSAAEWAK